jgi:hypothetical protein
MKRIAIVSLLIVSVAVLAGAAGKTDPADAFVNYFSSWLIAQKHNVTTEEKDALRTVHRLLIPASRDAVMRRNFWSMVSGTETREIEWDRAKEMILGGQAQSVMQTHSLSVSITGRDGIQYRTREPNIDDVLRLVKEVDPKRVFMGYGTE